MRQRARWLGLGLISLAVGASAYLFLVRTRVGQTLDEWSGGVVRALLPGVVGDALSMLARPAAIVLLAFALFLLLPWALAAGRWMAAAASTIVALASSPVALELRTSFLARPDLGVGGYASNTYPSTHAAAAFSLVVAVLLVWPREVGATHLLSAGVLILLVGAGNITSHAHRPSDVLGSLLLVAAMAAAVVAVTGVLPGRPGRPK